MAFLPRKLMRWLLAVAAASLAPLAAAAQLTVDFDPRYSGPEVNAGFAGTPVVIATKDPLAIPKGESIVSGTISGAWGNDDDGCGGCRGSAGVDVLLNGALAARCLASDPTCYCPDSSPCAGKVPWSRPLTPAEIAAISSGPLVLSVVQTSPRFIRLGHVRITVETAPPAIPTLSPAALAALFGAMVSAGLLAVSRRPARRQQGR